MAVYGVTANLTVFGCNSEGQARDKVHQIASQHIDVLSILNVNVTGKIDETEVVNGYSILRRTVVPGDLDVIMGHRQVGHLDYFVTARHQAGDREWVMGHYHTIWTWAAEDFQDRVKESRR